MDKLLTGGNLRRVGLLIALTGWIGFDHLGQAQDDTVLVQPPAYSEENQLRGPIVKDIEIEFAGSQSVDRSLILSNMRTTIGQPYSPAAVQEDVRNLYATGQFVNLRIFDEPLGDGVKVVLIVQPKPVIKQIIVTGADRISEKRVRKEMKSKAGEPLSEQQVAEDARNVRIYYHEKGFPDATVEYKFDVNEQIGRAVVTITVDEGSKSYVRDVNFVGNDSFETKELRKLFKTRKKNLLFFLNKSGIFREEWFDEDLKKLRAFYQDNGYIDFAVKDIQYDQAEEDVLDITITIFEGIQYRVGSMSFESNTIFSREQILSRLRATEGTINEGGVFSPSGLQSSVSAINTLYGERGYIDASSVPERQPNIETGKMDILYRINEGEQAYVQKIIIQGNNETKDKVLRRELALAPGDIYDTVRVDASKLRLDNLGYFSQVDATPRDTSVPNRKDLVVTVEEQRTGSVTFGAGFSTIDSLLGFAEVSQGNFDIGNWPTFRGGGQKFRARIQYGLTRQDALISWTEPWFLDRQISFGFDLFYNNSDFISSRFNQRRYGAAIRVGKALNQFWSIGLRYQAENIEIYDVDQTLPQFFQDEAGVRSKSSVRATLLYDNRDSLFLTRQGEKLEFALEGAGGPLLGDTDIWKAEIEGSKWWSLPWDMIFSIRAATGVADGFDGNDVPLFDRFFIGGNRTVRGFAFREIGPVQGGEESGGKTMAYTNFETTFPIMDNVRGAVFLDAGINNANTFDYSIGSLGVGTGVGLRLNLPIGPLRFDLGTPLLKNNRSTDDFDIEFHFDVGYQF
ncbi:MAG: outer membrane protein assembly factor BamA [Verrucomicrobiota bacterium]